MIAIFVGSFNPVTIAHYEIVKRIEAMPNISQVIIVPVSDFYQKPGLNVSGYHRIKMLKLAMPKIIISDFEIRQKKQLKSLNTLDYFKSQYNEELALVIGGDNFADFHNWYHYQEILDNYNLIVISRQINALDILNNNYLQYRNKITIINDLDLKISSTKAKTFLNNKYLALPVIEYIKKNNLYK